MGQYLNHLQQFSASLDSFSICGCRQHKGLSFRLEHSLGLIIIEPRQILVNTSTNIPREIIAVAMIPTTKQNIHNLNLVQNYCFRNRDHNIFKFNLYMINEKYVKNLKYFKPLFLPRKILFNVSGNY